MPIVATAGHVDHGKSTLVEALTGRDPDRWREEKERGLTIDLGFAWTEIDGRQVGFVDVPGHERFIKNMLAGVGGMDVALLVVAADEGWMPQTEEHLAVLDLLDVSHGVVALTRIDLADEDIVELAELEIGEKLAGTSLSGSPIVGVSAPAGVGLAELRAALAAALSSAGPPADFGRPRLWVDRSFVISGAGVVVTGTLLDGALATGDAVELLPGPQPARVRSLQSHEKALDDVPPGNRVAVNLSGLDRTDVSRGALLTHPGHSHASDRFLATVRPIRGLDEIAPRGAYQLHAGSGAWPARVRMIDSGTVLLSADQQIPLACGDRYVLRETGRRAIVGGGRVIDPRPGRVPRHQLAAAAASLSTVLDTGPTELATALMQVRGVASLNELEVDSRGGTPRDAIVAGDQAIARERAGHLITAISHAVTEFQRENPLRPGIPKASLASSHAIDGPLLEALLAEDENLIDDGATVRTADHGAAWSAADQAAWELAADKLRAAGLAAPRVGQLGLSSELLHAALREGRLVRVAADLVYLPEALDQMRARMLELNDEFTVAEFRDAMDISRRQAVPLLEWFDATGVTSRSGDVRSLRQGRPQ